jgi:hypothetical protein
MLVVILSIFSFVIYCYRFSLHLLPPHQNEGKICHIVGCVGLGQPMRWYSDTSRIDEERFVFSGDGNHKENLRDGSIINGL